MADMRRTEVSARERADLIFVRQCDTMSDMDKDEAFSFRLPADMLRAIQQTAQEEDRTPAEIVRRAIRQYLETGQR